MKTSPNDRELYLAYRLGELPPAERDAIEAQLLAENEFSDRMQEAEYDLLDDYHAGRLTSAVQGRVKRAFSPDELRQPLPLAARTNGQHANALSRRSPRFSVAFRFASAAAVLLLIGGAGWVLIQHHHSGTVSPIPAAHTASAPSGLRQNSGKPSTRTAVSPSHAPGEIAVLLLAPAVTRGGGSAELELRPATRAIRVQWLVPSDLAGNTFSLLIEQEGKEVAAVPASKLQHVGGSDVEEFTLPRTVFSAAGPDAHYVFVVRKSGVDAATEAEFAVHVSGNLKH